MDEVTKLIAELKDKKNHGRQLAALALSGIQDPRVVPALMDALKDTDATVRLYAAVILGELAASDSAPLLRDALPTLRRLRIRNVWSGPEIQTAIDKIEAATAGMKDLPLPAAAPPLDSQTLPLPAVAPILSPDHLPVPSAPRGDNTSDCHSQDTVPRNRRWWLIREKRR